MRITFKFLKEFALSKGIYVEKARCGGRNVYEWWKQNDHSTVGVCDTIEEAYREIYWEK